MTTWTEHFKATEALALSLMAEIDRLLIEQANPHLALADQQILALFGAPTSDLKKSRAYVEAELGKLRAQLAQAVPVRSILGVYALGDIQSYMREVHMVEEVPNLVDHKFFRFLSALNTKANEIAAIYSDDNAAANSQIEAELAQNNPWVG